MIEPGIQTTVQDLGRCSLARYGVSPGGALDRAALILGNRLLDNDPGEAGLEVTLLGPRLAFTGPAIVALVGADLGARLNGEPVLGWHPFAVGEGDELSFLLGDGCGVRAYVCIAGGLAVEPVLGSRSTDLVGRFGGVAGRALQAGDEIGLREAHRSTDHLLRRRLASSPPNYDLPLTARVTLGPQQEQFTGEGVATFLESAYRVSAKADRTGTRLTGPAISHAGGADLLSEGTAHGAVQVPGDGQPIVLLAARHTAGGYAKVATGVGADLDQFGQRRPGDTVRFVAVSAEEAREVTLAYLDALGPAAVVEEPRGHLGWGAGTPTRPGTRADGTEEGMTWDPAAVARLIEAAQAAGVTELRLQVEEIGLALELRRGLGDERLPPAPAGGEGSLPPTQREEAIISAPALGVFYRRSSPDLPPLAVEGEAVEAGQMIGVIEVMKTYHEVAAPEPGVLVAFLVDDGQFVEYGQPLARLAPP